MEMVFPIGGIYDFVSDFIPLRVSEHFPIYDPMLPDGQSEG